MNSSNPIPRRRMLFAAGAGVATALLAQAARAQNADLGSSSGPALSELKGKLYAVWREEAEPGLWFASFDGLKWSARARIAGVATSANPAVVTFNNKLYAAWKGRSADQRLWYAAFDGAQWSQQAQIPGAGSSSGPSLAVFNGKLFAMWKGSAGSGFSSALFDGSTWSSVQSAPPVTGGPSQSPPSPYPFTPQMIANSGLSGAGGIDQGKYNDCVFESSCAAVATTPRGQVTLSRAIMQDPDGAYVVTFPGVPHRQIKVTETDIKNTHVHDSATWADVLEAAMIVSDPTYANGSHPPPNAPGAAGGGKPTPAQYALYLLTGSPASRDLSTAPKIGETVARALRSGQPVVAFCSNNDQGALVSGHEWTVISCEPQAGRITLRNPWGKFGTAGTSKNGINYDGDAEVTMTLQQFGQFYKEVTFGYAHS